MEDVNVIFRHLNEYNKKLNKKNKIYCARYDIAKAFDSLVHSFLIEKFLKLGINNKILYLIIDMTIKATQTIEINGLQTDPIFQHRGNRQGGILEPLFWIVFYDCFLKHLNKNNDKEEFKGPELWPGKRINNLCYADDLMSFILTNKEIPTAIVTFQKHVDSLKNKMQKK